MTVFNRCRLDIDVFDIDVRRMRKGQYSDAYFVNTVRILEVLAQEGYTFCGNSDRPLDNKVIQTGELVVEMQFFTRRKPFSVVGGVDEALAILATCTGYFDEHGGFVNTSGELEIEAVHDGVIVPYEGNSMDVRPVLRVRGRYRDFACLETQILGVLTETTRVATNVYNVLVAAGGKEILFFPARFAHYRVQAVHGYAYDLGIQAYNRESGKNCRPMVSTDIQGEWWGGKGGGTIAHATIACFLGDTAETMRQFARTLPVTIPRIALVDFHNDCVGETLAVMQAMYQKYCELQRLGLFSEAEKYVLFAVRLDTSGDMRDASIPQTGDKSTDCGVNPRLVRVVREAMDSAYLQWEIPQHELEMAKKWCRQVKIVVTGGFNAQKISDFEKQGVPADIYGVGSSLLENSCANGSNNDYTGDIVKVQVDNQWYPLSKVGRSACDNPDLERVKI